MKKHLLSGPTVVLLLTACNSQAGSDTAQPAANTTAVSRADEDGTIDRALGLYPDSRSGGAPDLFVTKDPIDRVVEWYRDDTARRSEMMFVSTERQDDGYLVIGTAGEEGRSFALKLTPRPDGGTESKVLPYDPKKGLKQ